MKRDTLSFEKSPQGVTKHMIVPLNDTRMHFIIDGLSVSSCCYCDDTLPKFPVSDNVKSRMSHPGLV